MARFDAIADHYDAWCQTPLGHFVDAVERAVVWDVLDPHAGDTVGDLGCGTGNYAQALAEAGCRVIGIDESPAMLAHARAKSVQGESGGSVTYQQANLAALPLPSAQLDAVLLQVTLEFVADPSAVLTEAYRVVRPGGRLVLGLIYGGGPWAQHYQARAERDPHSVYRQANFWTLEDIRNLLGQDPVTVRAGLYVGPSEFRDTEEAWALERRRRTTPSGAVPGFVAARYDRLTSGPPLVHLHRS